MELQSIERDYEMIVTKSDTKPTKAGNGTYLKLEMQIVAGPFSGRRHWENLNLDNPSQQTVKIAQEQLARLCMAVGLDEIQDSEELHDRAFIATIGIDKKDPTRNVIWDYKPAEGAAPAPAPAVAAKPAAVAAPVKSQRPWG
ncbi:MAG: DUF669 domain-containing protein [Betaproteobacteria bacterium]|nr:DUF669 domain-containing protein [Betaproteobacteria bacterium]